MPEGDTVYLTAGRLRRVLAGRLLVSADLRVPRYATSDLSGRTVEEVVSRGKHLLTRLSARPDGVGIGEGPLTLHTHLRMEGSWRVFAVGERWRGGPASDVRVVLATAAHQAVGYRLGEVDLVPRADEDQLVGHLGPDLLGPDWDPQEAVRRLSAEPDREIGEALLDQRIMAGVGNLYKCEICFLRGISPGTPVQDSGDLHSIVDLAHRLLVVNRTGYAQSTTGDTRAGRKNWVYGQRTCLRCGTRLRRAQQGVPPQDRLSLWCPHCQPGPEPTLRGAGHAADRAEQA